MGEKDGEAELVQAPGRPSALAYATVTKDEAGGAARVEVEAVDEQQAWVALLGEDGIIRACSGGASRPLTGFGRTELLGHPLERLVPGAWPGFLVGARVAVWARTRAGRPVRASLELERIKAGLLWCRLRRLGAERAAVGAWPALLPAIPGLRLGALLGLGPRARALVLMGFRDGAAEPCAVKLLKKRQPGGGGEELRALEALHHPTIAQLQFAAETASHFVLALELCAGLELGQYLESRGPVLVCEEEARHLFSQLAASVAHVHAAGFTHGGLSPRAAIVCVPGLNAPPLRWERNTLKLVAFGRARRCEPESLLPGPYGRDPAWACPESRTGRPFRAAAADVWALGAVLHAVLAGRPPFRGEAAGPELAPALGPLAASLLAQVFAPAPAERATLDALLAHPWLKGLSPRPFAHDAKKRSAEHTADAFEDVTKQLRCDEKNRQH